MRQDHVWIVELYWDSEEQWVPTIIIAMTRREAQESRARWKTGSGLRYRVMKYIRTKEKTT